jgi:hypothetical protein
VQHDDAPEPLLAGCDEQRPEAAEAKLRSAAAHAMLHEAVL